MEAYRERLQKLKEQRRQASQANYKEVLDENEKSKRPANWEKKLDRNLKKLQQDEGAAKPDSELKRNLEIQANELDRWDKIKANKRRPDPGFIDFEAATKRQFDRLTKQWKPNLDEYNAIKEKVGEDVFYLKTNDQERSAGSSKEVATVASQVVANPTKPSTSALIIDSKEGIERMVQDVNKQIEVRSKRSRRRKFDDEADVDYINERNMRFNKKLERFYGTYTDDIKQNFERGTAL